MSVRESVEVDHAPSRISGVLAVMAGVIALVSVSLTTVLALLFGLLGVVGIAGGIFGLESRTGVVVGSSVLFVGVLVAGVSGAPAPILLAATIATVVALDLGQNAVSVGRQMTTAAFTRKGEFVHAVGTVVVSVVVAAIAYGVFTVSPSGQPVSALVLLLLATVFLVWSFRT
jgi:hypothetical protein